MKRYTQDNVDSTGFEAMVKKPNLVLMQQQDEDFTVVTTNGLLRGDPGDYLAHDPMSGHVWPVQKDYVAMHYESQSDRLTINPVEDPNLVEISDGEGTTILTICSLEHGMAIAKVVALAKQVRPDGKYGTLNLGALEMLDQALSDMERLAGARV